MRIWTFSFYSRSKSFLIFATRLVPKSLPAPCIGNCETKPSRRTVTCPLPLRWFSKVQPRFLSHLLNSEAFIGLLLWGVTPPSYPLGLSPLLANGPQYNTSALWSTEVLCARVQPVDGQPSPRRDRSPPSAVSAGLVEISRIRHSRTPARSAANRVTRR